MHAVMSCVQVVCTETGRRYGVLQELGLVSEADPEWWSGYSEPREWIV